MLSILLTVAVSINVPAVYGAVDGQTCYTSGGVAGIVIATVVVTVVIGGLAGAALWYLWKQRSGLSGEGKKKPGSTFFSSASEKNCVSLEQELRPEKKRPPEGGKEAYAFDNPFFKDDETDTKNQDAAEKGESGFRADNGDLRNSPNNKVNAGSKLKKNRPFSNIQFPNVFHQGFKKPRAMDDNFIPKALERVEVPLRGHDFTGLGFNICGNMRDGIFVKDVLHRGPASESGKIKAGDRIVGVRVSFGGMVYEDALTILSYASPYDVRLELEKTVDAKRNLALPVSSPASKTRLMSSSFRSGQRLFHPLYRSQSFDDLTQIGKENQLSLNNNNGTATQSGQNSCNSCPKRSQSIEAATSPKLRIPQENAAAKGSRQSSTSSCESAKKSSPTANKASVTTTEMPSKKSLLQDAKQPNIAVESLQQAAADVETKSVTKVAPNAAPKSPQQSIGDSTNCEDLSNTLEEKPMAPPRKVASHTKRKAPAPPKGQLDPAKTETSAIVHRDAGDDLTDGEIQEQSMAIDDSQDQQEETIESEKSEELAESNDIHSLSGDTSTPSISMEDPTSSPKRKASSLGDLTTLDSAGHKKNPASLTILERAVSLDLQQTMPEGNLVKQKMILNTPTFEDPEGTSAEDLLPDDDGIKIQPNLTRWHGNLSESQNNEPSEAEVTNEQEYSAEPSISKNITNGHVQSVQDNVDGEEVDEVPSYFAFDSPNEEPGTHIRVTSTPIRKIIEAESFFKDTVDIDDIPYLGDSSLKDKTTGLDDSKPNGGTHSVILPPMPLSIPIIKPNFSQYEKLSSPGKSPSARASPSSVQESPSNEDQRQGILGQDISSIEPSYKPVFSSNSFRRERDSSVVGEESSELSALDIVNGNGLDISTSSYGQYRTASEDSTISDTSHPESKFLKDLKKHSLPEITGIKVHGGAAGFAKTLIISTPIEGESISLNADLDSPPPKLEPPL